MGIDEVMKCANKAELDELLTLFANEAKISLIQIEQKELEIRLIRANMEHSESYQRMAQLQIDKLNSEQKGAK